MRIFEVTGSDPMVTRLVAVTDQLKTDLENDDMPPDTSLTDFLRYLRKYDIIVDKSDLYDMIKNPPLKNLISNIQGEKVIFKGPGQQVEQPEDQSQEVVANMAQSAMK